MSFSASTLISRPVLACSSAEQAEAMNRSFEQYLVPMRFDEASFQRRFRGENLDAEASRLWYCGEELVGVVYIARRGWTSRVAAMGVVLEARGLGLGKPMLQTAIDEARRCGDRTLMLEVFVNNERAIRLYERLGFRITRRLQGFQQPAERPTTPADSLTKTDPLTVARTVTRGAVDALPWMMAGETLAATTEPFVEAWRLENNAFALVRPDAERVMLLSLIVPKASRRQGWGTRMVRALEAKYAGRSLTVHSLLPESGGPQLLRRCGWEPSALELYEMECVL
ncbi:GNAT family N-acetyltransferase [Hymenobacter koreensis]|uniref:N-acetyltransferase domain-containing protein n=1 Tax=Hymenobacter koreensis TaxID=1084523 RepID=A0ABP8J9D4_9BACT